MTNFAFPHPAAFSNASERTTDAAFALLSKALRFALIALIGIAVGVGVVLLAAEVWGWCCGWAATAEAALQDAVDALYAQFHVGSFR